MSFEARWRSTCADCLEDILPGQMIKTSGGAGYQHVICPDPDEVVSNGRGSHGVCPNCNMELTAENSCGDCGWLGY